ncbi:MAG: subtilisin family serine protease [Rickettsiales bacterium]|jgi:subtilisin family serine protease
MFFLLSLLSIVVIGGAAAGGGGGGGGGGSSEPSEITPTPTPGFDTAVDQDQIDSFKTTEYNSQYGLGNIKAAEAYSLLQTNNKAIGGDGVKVFIADTGVRLTHIDIAGNDHGSLHTSPSSDYDGHGTHVASIASGVKNDLGMHGVAFSSDIIAVRLDLEDSVEADMSMDPYDGVEYAAQNGAKVINMSWGSSSYSSYNGEGSLAALSPKLLIAKDNDALMVVATGNDADNNGDGQTIVQNPDYLNFPKPVRPALYANNDELDGFMLAVGATDENNNIADFSNICGVTKDFCLFAPGVSIIGAYNSGDYYQIYLSGTSQAAPHVSGAAAVLRGAWTFLTAPQTAQILLDTATDLGAAGVDDIYGHGLLNLESAVTAQGANNVASSSIVSSAGSDARTSSISSHSIFGNAFSANVAPILKNAVFFDKYGRDYKANLDQKISSIGSNPYSLDNFLFNDYSTTGLPMSFGKNRSNNLSVRFNARNLYEDPISGQMKNNKFGLKHLTIDRSKEDKNGFNSSDVSFAYSRNFSKGLKIGFSKNDFNGNFNQENPAKSHNLISYNNFATSPYKKLSAIVSTNNDSKSQISTNQLSLSQKLTPKLTTSLSFSNYSYSNSVSKFSSDESRIFDSSVGYKINKKTKIGFSLGNLDELNNNLLGSKSEGAFSSGSNPATKYVTFSGTRDLVGSWKVTASYSEGKTDVSGNSIGVFRDFSDIKSRGSAMGLLNNDFFGGSLALVYSEPLRIYKGSANLDIPISRDDEGNVQRLTANGVSLAPDGKERDLEISYSTRLKYDRGTINYNALVRQEPDNIKGAKSQYLMMVRYNLKF